MPPPAPDLPVGPALFRLDERVAVITGAGGAFGRATALGFVRAGARVMLTDIDADEPERGRPPEGAAGSRDHGDPLIEPEECRSHRQVRRW